MMTVAMEKKNLRQPDEVVRFEKGELATVTVGGATVARAVFEPGWRWSTHVGGGTGQALCQVPHLGYVESGRLAIEMADGSHIEMGAGDTAYVPAATTAGPSATRPASFWSSHPRARRDATGGRDERQQRRADRRAAW